MYIPAGKVCQIPLTTDTRRETQLLTRAHTHTHSFHLSSPGATISHHKHQVSADTLTTVITTTTTFQLAARISTQIRRRTGPQPPGGGGGRLSDRGPSAVARTRSACSTVQPASGSASPCGNHLKTPGWRSSRSRNLVVLVSLCGGEKQHSLRGKSAFRSIVA